MNSITVLSLSLSLSLSLTHNPNTYFTYFTSRGVYNIFVKGENDPEPIPVGKYDTSGSFGELALMYNLPRAATIQAVTSGALWAMERTTFRRILLKSACRKRRMYESLLENVPMLKTLEVSVCVCVRVCVGKKLYVFPSQRNNEKLLNSLTSI